MPKETVQTPQPDTQPKADRPLDETLESKSTNWTKIILAAIVGLGLLAGSAYAGYYYGTQQVQQPEKPTPVVSQPTPKPTPAPEPTTPIVEDETGSWKTYTNTRFGYELKYPLNFTIYSFADNCTHFLSGDRTSRNTIWFSIGVREGMPEGDSCFPTGLGVVEKEEELDRFVFKADGKDYQLRDVRLIVPPDDYVWGALTLDQLGWPTIENKLGREDFSVFYTIPYPRYGSEISIVRKILSTFKFL